MQYSFSLVATPMEHLNECVETSNQQLISRKYMQKISYCYIVALKHKPQLLDNLRDLQED